MSTDKETVDAVEDAPDSDLEADNEADKGDDTGHDEEQSPPRSNGRGARFLRGTGRNIGVILVVTALIASAGVAAWLFFFQFRPDQQTNAAAQSSAVDAAKNGSIALLSYSPDTLDKDFANAKTNLTGDFLSYYTQFTEQIVTPAAKEKAVKTSASVVRAAVVEIHPDSAVVLVFINQVTTSKENPDGAFAASAVKVGMRHIDGRWLIDAFDPV